jgi:hypothetical protein
MTINEKLRIIESWTHSFTIDDMVAGSYTFRGRTETFGGTVINYTGLVNSKEEVINEAFESLKFDIRCLTLKMRYNID